MLFYRRQERGEPVAMLDRCPHRFAYLSKGRRMGNEIECLYHGLRFGADGACTHSPYQDAPPPGARVETFLVVERHKMIWIWMGDPALADPATIPDHGHMDVDWMKPLLWHVRYAGNWQLGNDNLMELTHLFFLHTSTIGGWKEDPGSVPGETYNAKVERWPRPQPYLRAQRPERGHLRQRRAQRPAVRPVERHDVGRRSQHALHDGRGAGGRVNGERAALYGADPHI